MTPWIRPAGAVALALFVLLRLAGAATAASIPAEAADQPKLLWKHVMETFYGPYDRRLKCWTLSIAAERVCMRPHRLDRVAIGGVDHLFLVIGGSRLGEDGERQEAHADSGVLGLVVLQRRGGALELAARNDLHAPFGTFGAIPGEESFAVREIGPGGVHGWVAREGWMGQGHLVTSSAIFAPLGDTVARIGSIPDHYDNSGNCENGLVIGSDTPCTDYSAELLFDTTDASARFFPVVVRISGTREGSAIEEAFETTFDPAASAYRKIEGLPPEFADGI